MYPITLAAGALILFASGITAQQRLATGSTATSDSASCTAAATYLAAHPTEGPRIQTLLTEFMMSPETQEVLQTAIQAMMDNPDGSAQTEIETGATLPDTFRIPFTDALTRGQLDSARAIAHQATQGRPEAAAGLTLTLGFMRILPDTLRNIFAESMRTQNVEWGEQCPDLQAALAVPMPMQPTPP